MNLQYVPDLYTCRICLDTEAKLFDINKCGLAPILAEFTSITTFNMPGMPQYVCNFCYFQLQKSAAFRNKCIATQNLLHNCLLMHSLSLEFIQTVDRSKLKLPWTRSELVHLTCIEEVSLSDTGLKQECEVDKVCKAETVVAENDYNVNLCSDDDDHFDNREFSVDVKLETVKNEDIQENESKKSNKRKQKQIATKPKRSKRNEAKKDSVFNVNCEEKEKYDQDKNNEEIIDPLDSDDEVLANKASAKVKKNKTVLKNFDDSEDEDIKEGIKDKRRVVKRGKRENKREAKQNQLDMKRKDDMKRFGEEYNFEVICLTLHDQLQEMEARKTTSNYKESPFKCALCFRGFRSEDTYHSHMLSHDPSTGSEICEICRARFPTRRKLTKHMRSHRTKFICKACAAVFRCSTEAKMHYQGHGGREFVCEHCGKIFTRYRSRVEHIRIYHGTTRCDICYKGVSNAYAVIAHKAKAHREVFICDLCNTSFNKKTALNRHISSLNGALCDTVRPCSACGENFPSEPQLQEHIGTWHPHVRPDSSKRGRRVGSKGKKRCCPCGHRGDYPLPEKPENNPLYPQDYKIMDYKMDIYSKDVYKDDCAPKPISGPYGTFTPLNQCCCPCKTIFKKREKKDEESDVKKKTYMCEVCALDKFPSAAALRNHQRIHTGEKPYQCPLCPKRFRGQEYLTYHLNVHTGERPYKCPNCPKAFKNPTANHRHQLVHNKKRPHRCEICDKTFQTSTYLKIHVRTVHMKIPMPPRVRNRKKILK